MASRQLGQDVAAAVTALIYLAALSPLLSHAGAQLSDKQPLVQLDGSGTSNPAPLIWKYMEAFMARSKPAVSMTYRAIGTNNGLIEFITPTPRPANDFSMGDVPASLDQWQTLADNSVPMLHVPLMVGSVSIYHNIQGVGKGATGITLSPCTLARIFTGNITGWGHPDVLADNPASAVIQELGTLNPPIVVFHRNNGSSSTWGLTNYLFRACPQKWDATLFPVGYNTPGWPGNTVSNSDGMTTGVATTPYGIGYVESGQGVAAGLKEVNIKNKANNILNFANATVVDTDVLNAILPSTLASSAWTNVSLIWQDGANQWPITLITYYFVRQNVTFLGDAGGLLKTFLNYTWADPVSSAMPSFGFLALPKATRLAYQADLDVSLATAGATWFYENATVVQTGQRDYVISEARGTYVDKSLQSLTNKATSAAATLLLGNAYQVHGSGSIYPARYIRQVMELLEGRSRLPIDMTYRAVGTVEAQAEMLSTADMYTGYNHFKVGDIPLSPAQYSDLSSNSSTTQGVVHLPFAVGGVAVFYNQPVPLLSLNLDGCLLAGIYNGTITMWSQARLAEVNGWTAAGLAGSPLINHGITVYAYAAPNSNTMTLYQYLRKACPGFTLSASDAEGLGLSIGWPARVTTVYPANTGTPISTPQDMAAAIAGTPHSIGYVQASVGLAARLHEAQLQNRDGNFINSSSANFEQAVLAATFPTDFTASFSGVDLVYAAGATTWPMTTVQYFYAFPNLVPYGQSGPLLVAFFNFTLSDEGQALMAAEGLHSLPSRTLLAARTALPLGNTFNVAALLQEWAMEQPNEFSDLGMGLYTFSGNRKGHLEDYVEEDVATVATVEAAATVRLRVAGPGDLAQMLTLAMGSVADSATAPVKINFEVTSSSQALAVLMPLDATRPDSAPAHMLVASQPLTADHWSTLAAAGVQVLQAPFLVRPVVLSYRGATGVYFSACSLYRILAGTITKWNDPALLADNPGHALSANVITLTFSSTAGGDVIAMIQYAQKACTAGGKPAIDLGSRNELTVNTVGAFVANAPELSWLGIMPLSTSDDFGLSQVALQAAQPHNGGVTAASVNSTAVYSTQLENALVSGAGVPTDPTGNWTSFSLAFQSSSVVYPVLRADFIMVPADMTTFGSAGPALQGVYTFLTTYFQTEIVPAYGLYYGPLGEAGQQYATSRVVPRIQTAAGLPMWPVLNTSAQAGAGSADLPIILNRYSVSDVLRASAGGSTYLTPASVQQICNALVAQVASPLVRSVQSQQSKLDTAYNVAVAAITLVCLLLVAMAVLVVHALWPRNSKRSLLDLRTQSGTPFNNTQQQSSVAPGSINLA